VPRFVKFCMLLIVNDFIICDKVCEWCFFLTHTHDKRAHGFVRVCVILLYLCTIFAEDFSNFVLIRRWREEETVGSPHLLDSVLPFGGVEINSVLE